MNTLARLIEELTEDERERFEERAAIMEFDGGMSREDAERSAYADVKFGPWRVDT